MFEGFLQAPWPVYPVFAESGRLLRQLFMVYHLLAQTGRGFKSFQIFCYRSVLLKVFHVIIDTICKFLSNDTYFELNPFRVI
jgi:hypothetical protein